jgi:hypothetical protein
VARPVAETWIATVPGTVHAIHRFPLAYHAYPFAQLCSCVNCIPAAGRDFK